MPFFFLVRVKTPVFHKLDTELDFGCRGRVLFVYREAATRSVANSTREVLDLPFPFLALMIGPCSHQNMALRFILTVLVGVLSTSVAFATVQSKALKCVTRDGVRSMTLTYLKKDLSYLDISDGKTTHRCPFRTLKIEDRKPKAERSVRVHLQAAGACDPKLPAANANLRKAMVLQIDLKGNKKQAQMRDPKVDIGAPCELENFRFEVFGLKAK